MAFTRREVLVITAGGAAFVALPAFASTNEYIDAFTGGAEVADATDLTLETPEIAENGNTVPVTVSAKGATAISLFAMGNPVPPVATFHFGPLSASHVASTRIRLAGTQEVLAIAKMEDGTFQKVANTVKVTIGGCGG